MLETICPLFETNYTFSPSKIRVITLIVHLHSEHFSAVRLCALVLKAGSFTGVALFTKKHRRSPSHFNLKYGRENSPPESPVKEVVHITCEIESKEGLEVCTNIYHWEVFFHKNESFNFHVYF